MIRNKVLIDTNQVVMKEDCPFLINTEMSDNNEFI